MKMNNYCAIWLAPVGILALLVVSPIFAGEPSADWLYGYSPPKSGASRSASQPGSSLDNQLSEDSVWFEPTSQRSQSVDIGILDSPTLDIGISGSKRQGRDLHGGAAQRGLGELDDSYELGFFTNGRYGNYLFGTRVSKDVSGGHEGTLGEFMAGYERRFTEKLGLSLGVGATWADENYMASYYGVNASQASRSGLSQYTPGAGFTNATLQMTACYQLTENWSFGAKVGYLRLIGAAADSPVASLEESKQQFVTGLQFQFALPDIGTQGPTRQYQPNCSAR